MKSVAVILPTIGSPVLKDALDSLSEQTYKDVTILVGVDGPEYREQADKILVKYPNLNKQTIYLKENVGAGGFYGQRIYAAFSHLVNKDILLFLDQDNWYEPTHVESIVNTFEEKNPQWVYSLRNIYSPNKEYITKDDCESLGKWEAWTKTKMVDTNCYAIPKEIAIRIASFWHSGWGEDRVIFNVLNQNFPNYECTGEYTVNYRLGGNEGSVTKEFFIYGNSEMTKQYNGNFPWRKNG